MSNSDKPICKKPWVRMTIKHDLSVKCCCWHHGTLGNLGEGDFESVWNGDIVQEMRRKLLNGEMPKQCHCLDVLGYIPDEI